MKNITQKIATITATILTILLTTVPAQATTGDKLTTPPPTLTNPQTITVTTNTGTINTAKNLLIKYNPITFPIPTTNVYTNGGSGNYKGATDWPNTIHAKAPTDFTATAGTNYQTPGYK